MTSEVASLANFFERITMKKLTMAVGAGVFAVASLGLPLRAQVMPQDEPLFKSNSTAPSRAGQTPRKMAIYRDCLETHANVDGAEFKKVNKFCSCVADQSLEGNDGTFSTCAKGDGGGTLGMIGEMAPTVLMGVLDELAKNPPSRSGGSGGLLERGGGLLNGLGGLLGGGGGFSLKDLNIKDLLKNGL
jgi:hypothetical protein